MLCSPWKRLNYCSELFDIRDAMWIWGRRRFCTEAEGRDEARDQSLKVFDALMN